MGWQAERWKRGELDREAWKRDVTSDEVFVIRVDVSETGIGEVAADFAMVLEVEAKRSRLVPFCFSSGMRKTSARSTRFRKSVSGANSLSSAMRPFSTLRALTFELDFAAKLPGLPPGCGQPGIGLAKFLGLAGHGRFWKDDATKTYGLELDQVGKAMVFALTDRSGGSS